MYPIKKWKEIKRTLKFKTPYPKGFGSLTGKPHLGVDYVIPVGTKIYAYADCEVKSLIGKEGGNTIWVKAKDGYLVRFLHLRDKAKSGKFKEGDIIGISGNTGLSTSPHTHCDVSKNGKLELNNLNNFVDPDKYFEKYSKDLSTEPLKSSEPISTGPNVELVTEVKNEPILNESTLNPNPQPQLNASAVGDGWIDVSPDVPRETKKPLFRAVIDFIKCILSR